MKIFSTIALVAILSQTGCMKNTTPGNPVVSSPNAGVIATLETAAAGCNVTAALEKNPTISAWLAGPCVSAMTGILDTVEANGTLAQVQAIITTLKNTIAQFPSGTPDIQYANAALVLAQDAFNAYVQATGQLVGVVAPTSASQFFAAPAVHKIHWTATEKARIKAARAKLAAARK